jgi:hypothetical protein
MIFIAKTGSKENSLGSIRIQNEFAPTKETGHAQPEDTVQKRYFR